MGLFHPVVGQMETVRTLFGGVDAMNSVPIHPKQSVTHPL